MKYDRFSGFVSLLILAGCAAPKPTKDAPFLLIEGKAIGRLELAEDKGGWTEKSKDSAAFDQKYVHTRPRIGFKYPGETITLMKVFDGEKLIKECDEGSYTRQKPGMSMTGGGWAVGAGGKMSYQPGFASAPKEEYAVKYNLECEIPELKSGMTVELEGPEGMVSKYRVEIPQ